MVGEVSTISFRGSFRPSREPSFVLGSASHNLSRLVLPPCLVTHPALHTRHVPSHSLSVSVALLSTSSNTLLTTPGALCLNSCTMAQCSSLGQLEEKASFQLSFTS